MQKTDVARFTQRVHLALAGLVLLGAQPLTATLGAQQRPATPVAAVNADLAAQPKARKNAKASPLVAARTAAAKPRKTPPVLVAPDASVRPTQARVAAEAEPSQMPAAPVRRALPVKKKP